MLIRTSTSLQNELGKGKVNTVYALYQGYNLWDESIPRRKHVTKERNQGREQHKKKNVLNIKDKIQHSNIAYRG